MTRLLVALVAFLIACGGRARSSGVPPAPAEPLTLVERMIALLPEGVQLLVEVDLARLRANQVVGEVAARALAQLGDDSKLPGLPMTVQGSPLASSDVIVLAAYGVGTAQAASVTLLATKQEVAGATRVTPEIVALGPESWIAQLEARAAIAANSRLAPSLSLMSLRAHAMPPQAPGAVLRVTARLPFDARVALARTTGLDTAPAQLSIWADIVDDLAIIIDADAADPGERRAKESTRRLGEALTEVYAAVANEPAVRALGLSGALRDMRMISERTWVRTIITVGPRQLARVAERARAMLGPPQP